MQETNRKGTEHMKKLQPASDAAFLQAIMDGEGLSLDEQYRALSQALTAVNRKRQEAIQMRAVDAARRVV